VHAKILFEKLATYIIKSNKMALGHMSNARTRTGPRGMGKIADIRHPFLTNVFDFMKNAFVDFMHLWGRESAASA